MTEANFIYHMWYVAAAAGEIKRGKTITRTLLDQKLLIGRDEQGDVFALRDFCPHRGIPLSYGTFDGTTIECCYHGWCFNTKGHCTDIPALAPDSNVDISRIKAKSFPCRERNGVIWVYVPAAKDRLPETIPDLPKLDYHFDGNFYVVDQVELPCDVDHAVIGLMDPSHGPFVHASWWWRTTRSMHVKEKKFAPNGLGFSMLSHKPSSNSRAYKILGSGERKTQISFSLPSLRSEHITIGNHHIFLLTALTPIDGKRTMLHQFFYTTIPLLNVLKTLLKPFGKAFIQQDLKVVHKQAEGLQGDHPALMLLGDADQQALWYFKLKKDYLEAQAQHIPFENRLPEKTLKWRS